MKDERENIKLNQDNVDVKPQSKKKMQNLN
jgi:hypothetical protein